MPKIEVLAGLVASEKQKAKIVGSVLAGVYGQAFFGHQLTLQPALVLPATFHD